MSARHPRFEVVRTDAGWHARFRASNGQVVWTTEVYTRRRTAEQAIRSLGAALSSSNRAWIVPGSLRLGTREGSGNYPVEVLEVNERPLLPPDLTDAVALGAWAARQPAVRKAIRENKKIHAIKELRALTGASLLDSKQAIEQAMP